MRKGLILFLCTFILFDFVNTVFSQSNTADREAVDMIKKINQVPLGMIDDKAGGVFLDELQQFLESHSHDLSNSVKHKLQKNISHLENFFLIREGIQECKSEATEILAAQIIDAAGQAKDLDFPCHLESKEHFTDLKGFTGEIDDIVGLADPEKTFFDDLKEQSMVDLAVAYTLHQYTFSGEVPVEKVKTKWKILCHRPHPRGRQTASNGKNCSKNLQVRIQRAVNRAIKEMEESNPKRYSSDREIREELNLKIENLNDLKKAITPLGATNGFGYDTRRSYWPKERQEALKDLPPEEAAKELLRDKFERYQESYLSTIGQGVGTLLLSQSLQKKVGKFESLDEGLEILNNRKCSFGPTNRVRAYRGKESQGGNPYDYNRCIVTYGYKNRIGQFARSNYEDMKKVPSTAMIKKAKEEISNYIEKAAGIVSQSKPQQNLSLIRMVNSNPVSLGQVLINNPRYMSQVCSSMEQLAEQKAKDEKWDNIYDYGGAVAGALILGSAFILPFAGVPIAATAWTVGLGGAALTAVELPYRVHRHQGTRLNSQGLMGSLFVDNAQRSQESLQSIRKAVEDFEEQSLYMGLLAGFSILDVVELGALIRSAKAVKGLKKNRFDQMSDQEKKDQLVYLSNYFKSISKSFSREGKILANSDNLLSWAVKKLGQDQVGDFLTILANSLRYQFHGHKELGDKLFSRMAQMNQEEIVRFIQTTLDISKRHGHGALEKHYKEQIKNIRYLLAEGKTYRVPKEEEKRIRERRIRDLNDHLKAKGVSGFYEITKPWKLKKDQEDFLISIAPERASIILDHLKDYSAEDVQAFFSAVRHHSKDGSELFSSGLCGMKR